MDDWDAFQKARTQSEGKLGFYIHLAMFVHVGAYFIVHGASSYPEHPLLSWQFLSWLVVVLVHALFVFVVRKKPFESDRQIKKELAHNLIDVRAPNGA